MISNLTNSYEHSGVTCQDFIEKAQSPTPQELIHAQNCPSTKDQIKDAIESFYYDVQANSDPYTCYRLRDSINPWSTPGCCFDNSGSLLTADTPSANQVRGPMVARRKKFMINKPMANGHDSNVMDFCTT